MLSVLGSCGRGGSEQRFDYEEASDIQDSVRRNELGIPLDGYVTYQSRVSRGEFFSNILNGYGVSNQRIYRISQAIKDTFDIRDIRIGNEYEAYVSKSDSSLAYWVYDIDRRSRLVLDLSGGDTVSARIFRKQMQVRPRSGLAAKHGITVLNSPGTIDADYRGEIRIILVNLSGEAFTIEPGERIAQLVVARHEQVEWEPVEELGTTERGTGGFGSTGR